VKVEGKGEKGSLGFKKTEREKENREEARSEKGNKSSASR